MVDIVLTSALAGALVGAAADRYLSRPKPLIWVLDTYFDPMQSGDKEAIADEIFSHGASDHFLTPTNVYQTIYKNDYIEKLDRFYQHPSQYTFELYTRNRDNQNTRLLHSNMPQIIRELRIQFNTRLWGDLLSNWAQNSYPIMGQLKGMYVRQNFDVPKTKLVDANAAPIHQISTDKDGDYFVNVGRLRIPCVWSTDNVHASRLKAFMENIAFALAFEDREIIDALLIALEQVGWNDPNFSETANVIAAELARFEHVVVRGVIANGGQTPIAFDGRCSLVIYADKFSYSGTTIRGSLTVALTCVDDGKLCRLPSLEIKAGSATAFTAISNDYMYQLHSEAALRALYGNERNANVTFRRLDTTTLLSSKSFQFRRLER